MQLGTATVSSKGSHCPSSSAAAASIHPQPGRSVAKVHLSGAGNGGPITAHSPVATPAVVVRRLSIAGEHSLKLATKLDAAGAVDDRIDCTRLGKKELVRHDCFFAVALFA